MSIGSCPSAGVCAGVAACAGFVMANAALGNLAMGFGSLELLRICLKERASKVGMQMQKPDVLWHSGRRSCSGLWFTWPGMGVLGSACPEGDSAEPAAGQLSHGEKLAVSSQGLDWEPN